MITSIITDILTRELQKLKHEISSFKKEENLWIIDGEILNCAGNLCLHLVGNLNAYIGSELGNTGYIRHRDREFSDKNTPKESILRSIDDTISMIKIVVPSLSSKQLDSEYPLRIFKNSMTTKFFLVHLTSHLSYHLGQVNYCRRLLDN